MHKTIVSPRDSSAGATTDDWLDLGRLAHVELTSEDPAHPIEAALEQPARAPGWRAAVPGPQTITLRFQTPQALRLIQLRFESGEARTQEFQLTCRRVGESEAREIVRQQFHFAPSGATVEEEDYHVDLRDVTELTLHLTPDISRGPAHATLREWRIR